MNKRIDKKKKQNEAFRNKMKKLFAVFFCIALLVFCIRVTDMSIRRMIICNDDKYALAVSLQEDKLIRLDVAGEKFMISIEPAARIGNYVVSISRRYYDSFVKNIKDRL